GGSAGGPIKKDRLFYFFTYDGSRKVTPTSYTSFATFPLPCPAAVGAAQCAAANQFFASQLGSRPKYANQNIGFGKVDYQLNAKNHASVSFNMDNFVSPNSYATSATNTNSSVTTTGPSVTHERIF